MSAETNTGADVQTNVVAWLRNSTILGAIVGTRIFDDTPHDQENLDTSFPRVSIGTMTETDYGAQDVDMAQFTIEVNCYSRGLGKKECQDMMGIVRRSVIGQYAQKSQASLTGKIVSLMFDYSDGPRRESDGKTYFGMVRFRGLIQYG